MSKARPRGKLFTNTQIKYKRRKQLQILAKMKENNQRTPVSY